MAPDQVLATIFMLIRPGISDPHLTMYYGSIWDHKIIDYVTGIQWSTVRVTAVTVTVGYSDSFGNPRFITN